MTVLCIEEKKVVLRNHTHFKWTLITKVIVNILFWSLALNFIYFVSQDNEMLNTGRVLCVADA